MKKLTRILMAVLVLCFIASLAYAATNKAEINLAMHETMGTSGTSPFYIETIDDQAIFGRLKDSASGVSDFILFDRAAMASPCWSIQVTALTTTGGDATIDLAYKVINDEPTTAKWTAAPLIRIVNDISTSSGASVFSHSFNPPPGKYLRFYLTSGTTPFTNFEARVIVNNNGNCPEPPLIVLSSSASGVTLSASTLTTPDDADRLILGLISGATVYWRADGTSAANMGGHAQTVSMEPVVIDGYNAVKNLSLYSATAGATVYTTFFGQAITTDTGGST